MNMKTAASGLPASNASATSEIIERFYEGVPVTKTMGESETFYSNAKARELLGFEPEHSWRMYLDG